jgi:hypothetical protein
MKYLRRTTVDRSRSTDHDFLTRKVCSKAQEEPSFTAWVVDLARSKLAAASND